MADTTVIPDIETDEWDEDDIVPHSSLTPARIVQRRAVGLINAIYNYWQWLAEKDRIRRNGNHG